MPASGYRKNTTTNARGGRTSRFQPRSPRGNETRRPWGAGASAAVTPWPFAMPQLPDERSRDQPRVEPLENGFAVLSPIPKLVQHHHLFAVRRIARQIRRHGGIDVRERLGIGGRGRVKGSETRLLLGLDDEVDQAHRVLAIGRPLRNDEARSRHDALIPHDLEGRALLAGGYCTAAERDAHGHLAVGDELDGLLRRRPPTQDRKS